MSNNSDIKKFKSWLKIIESQLKVFDHSSCQEIFIFLRIYGKQTGAELMKHLSYSRGAIYTALKLLQEGKYVKREEDRKIKDKRKNVFYYAIDKELLITDENEFVQYLMTQNKIKIYLQWLKKSVKISTSMIDITYQFAMKNKLNKLDGKNIDSEKETPDIDSTFNSVITYSTIGSLIKRPEVIKKILTFLKELNTEFESIESSSDPIENPTLFSLFYIPL